MAAARAIDARLKNDENQTSFLLRFLHISDCFSLPSGFRRVNIDHLAASIV